MSKALGPGAVAPEELAWGKPSVILGNSARINKLEVKVAVDEKKAVKWAADIDEILSDESWNLSIADKITGRMSFARTNTLNRVGRAHARKLYHCILHPKRDIPLNGDMTRQTH